MKRNIHNNPPYFDRNFRRLATNRLGKRAHAFASTCLLAASFSIYITLIYVLSGLRFTNDLFNLGIAGLVYSTILSIPVSFAMGVLLDDLYDKRENLSLGRFVSLTLLNSIPSIALIVVGLIATLALQHQEILGFSLFGLVWIIVKATTAAIGFAILLGGEGSSQ